MFTDFFEYDAERGRAAEYIGDDSRTERRCPSVDQLGEPAAGAADERPITSWQMKITQPALWDMMTYLLAREPESAGLLLGPANDEWLITDFLPDRSGRGTPASFELGTVELNRVLKRLKPAGTTCKGIAHSHPTGAVSPSQGDLLYLQRVFGLPTNTRAGPFFLPIISSRRLHPYLYAHGRLWRAELVLL